MKYFEIMHKVMGESVKNWLKYRQEKSWGNPKELGNVLERLENVIE